MFVFNINVVVETTILKSNKRNSAIPILTLAFAILTWRRKQDLPPLLLVYKIFTTE